MIVITGGVGFIGSVIAAKLNQNGEQNILIVDENENNEKWKNLRKKQFSEFLTKEEFLALIENHSLKKRFRKKISAIIHMGACSDTTQQNMEYLHQTNYRYSISLLHYALENKIRFIYASSAAVYGDGKQGFNDSHTLTHQLLPLNKYGFSKWLFDEYVIHNGYAQQVTGLRFFNVFGPNEYHKGNMSSVIYKLFHSIQETGQIKLFESHEPEYEHGEQKRDFIYVKDAAEILLFFLNNNKTGIFNAGTGKAETFNSLAQYTSQAMDKKIAIQYFPMPEDVKKHYQYFTEADIQKLRNAGYAREFTPFCDAVSDYVKNYLLQQDPYL